LKKIQPRRDDDFQKLNFGKKYFWQPMCRKHFRQKIENWGSTSTD